MLAGAMAKLAGDGSESDSAEGVGGAVNDEL